MSGAGWLERKTDFLMLELAYVHFFSLVLVEKDQTLREERKAFSLALI